MCGANHGEERMLQKDFGGVLRLHWRFGGVHKLISSESVYAQLPIRHNYTYKIKIENDE